LNKELNLDNKNKIKLIHNNKLSCSYDSFYCIFINNIYINIIHNEDYMREIYYNYYFNKFILELIINFIKHIINIISKNNEINFYTLYNEYTYNNHLFYFLIINEDNLPILIR